MLSQFDRRDNSENKEHNRNGMSLGEMLAIIIASLTLLVAMIPLFRCPRFRRCVSSSISPFFKVYSPLLVFPKPICIYILNLVILHRKFSVLLPQTLCRQLLPPQSTQVPHQSLRFLYLVLSLFAITIPMQTLLVPVLLHSRTAKMASPAKMEGY